jgi:hypothetical protein
MELGSHLDPCIPTRDSMQVFQHNFDNFQRLSVVLPKPRTIFLRFGSNDFRIHRHCRSVYFPNCTQCLKAKLAQLTATHRVCQNLLDVQHVATSPDTGVLKAISSSLWSFSTRQCKQNDRKAHRRTSRDSPEIVLTACSFVGADTCFQGMSGHPVRGTAKCVCLFKIWRQIRLKSQEERAEGINILVGTCL